VLSAVVEKMASSKTLVCGKFKLELGLRTHIMGILNRTQDSFSDGGLFFDEKRAVEHALKMAADGADIIDIGGESTRPGAERISVDEELRRVMPLIERLVPVLSIPISIDTTKAEVAREALKAGASIVNDITGLHGDPEMARVVAAANAPVIIMHMQGDPRTMQQNPAYIDLIGELKDFFEYSIDLAKGSGIDPEKILLDPGIGFGKTVEHNLEIIKRLDEFKDLGRPIVIGTSRKSFIGKVLDADVDKRLIGTAATCAAAILRGADIIRVHDIEEMLQVAKMVDSIKEGTIKKDRPIL